jgi:hypothetical protein
VAHIVYVKSRTEWEEQRRRRDEEANRKRSVAMEGNQNASKKRDENSRVLPNTRLSGVKDRSNWTETQVAHDAGEDREDVRYQVIPDILKGKRTTSAKQRRGRTESRLHIS